MSNNLHHEIIRNCIIKLFEKNEILSIGFVTTLLSQYFLYGTKNYIGQQILSLIDEGILILTSDMDLTLKKE